jgi:hypothetical protein
VGWAALPLCELEGIRTPFPAGWTRPVEIVDDFGRTTV